MSAEYKEAERALCAYLLEITSRDPTPEDDEQAGRLVKLAQRAYGHVYNAESKAEIAMLVGMKWGFK